MRSSLFRSVFSVLLMAGLIFYVAWHGLHRQLLALPLHSWMISALLGWAVMLASSTMMFLARIGKIPSLKTLFLFPICQNLAGLLFPIQGSLAFSAIYFKAVHNCTIGRTVGINALFVLVYTSLVGMCGLSLAYSYENTGVMWLFFFVALIPVVFIAIPHLVATLHKNSIEKVADRFRLVQRMLKAIENVREQWSTLMTRPAILVLYFMRLFLYAMWFTFLNNALNTGLTTHQIIYLIFAIEASLVFKFTPGNWGISQASGGIALMLVDAPVNDGVLMVTVSMLSILLLNVLIGYFATSHFAQKFAFRKRRDLYEELANKQARPNRESR